MTILIHYANIITNTGIQYNSKMKQTRILNLCAKHAVDDGRVYHKLGKTMVSYGYLVHNTSPNVESHISIDNIHIHGFLQRAGFVNRVFSLKRLYNICVEVAPDVIFAHEPDALIIGYIFYVRNKKKYSTKLFFDCHEVYEYWFDGKTRSKYLNTLLNFFIKNLINILVSRITGVTSVNNTMTERFKKINQNSYMIPSITAEENLPNSIDSPKLKSCSVFFGQFFLTEFKQMLIDAATILKENGIHHCISIIGGERGMGEGSTTFEKMIKEKDLTDYFKFFGWLNRNESFKLMRQYPIGIMRFDSFYTKDNYGMPNKIFE